MPYRKLPPVVKSALTEGNLAALYLAQGLSATQIGEKIGVSRGLVHTYLHKYGIERRTIREATKQRVVTGRSFNPRVGEDSNFWKNATRRKTTAGYIDLRMPEHHRARASGYVLEHIVVWEQHHGELPPGWHIHHINGVKDDNRIENLQGMPARDHMRYIRSQQEVIQRYEAEIGRLRGRIAELEGRQSSA